jgi:hypothetical protein
MSLHTRRAISSVPASLRTTVPLHRTTPSDLGSVDDSSDSGDDGNDAVVAPPGKLKIFDRAHVSVGKAARDHLIDRVF